MSAYDTKITIGKDEDTDELTPQGLFYEGMSELDRISALNDLSKQLEEIKMNKDIRKDLYNQNIIDPGHDHIFPPKDRTTIFTHWESLDGWTIGGTGTEVISDYIGMLILTTGASANDTAFAQAITTGITTSFDVSQASIFQTSLKVNALTSQTAYFGVGDLDGAAGAEGYGFKIANGTLSGVTVESNNETLVTLSSTIDLDDNFNEYRATFDGKSTIRFYVNGRLEGTTQGGTTSRIPNTDSATYGTFFIQTTTTAARTMNAKYFYFSQINS